MNPAGVTPQERYQGISPAEMEGRRGFRTDRNFLLKIDSRLRKNLAVTRSQGKFSRGLKSQQKEQTYTKAVSRGLSRRTRKVVKAVPAAVFLLQRHFEWCVCPKSNFTEKHFLPPSTLQGSF